MSWEVWGDNDADSYDHLLEAGWWDHGQVDEVKAAISALTGEQVYEDGDKSKGISVRFLARLNNLRVAAGMLRDDDPLAIESKAMFAEQGDGSSGP